VGWEQWFSAWFFQPFFFDFLPCQWQGVWHLWSSGTATHLKLVGCQSFWIVEIAEANKSFTPSNSRLRRFLAILFSAKKELAEVGMV
jgi:hypothetical protein